MRNFGRTVLGYLGSICGPISTKYRDVPVDQRPVDKPKDDESPKKKGKLRKMKFKKRKKKRDLVYRLL